MRAGIHLTLERVGRFPLVVADPSLAPLLADRDAPASAAEELFTGLATRSGGAPWKELLTCSATRSGTSLAASQARENLSL